MYFNSKSTLLSLQSWARAGFVRTRVVYNQNPSKILHTTGRLLFTIAGFQPCDELSSLVLLVDKTVKSFCWVCILNGFVASGGKCFCCWLLQHYKLSQISWKPFMTWRNSSSSVCMQCYIIFRLHAMLLVSAPHTGPYTCKQEEKNYIWSYKAPLYKLPSTL